MLNLDPRRASAFLRRQAVPHGAHLRIVPAETRHYRALAAIVADQPALHVHVGGSLTTEADPSVHLWVIMDGQKVIGALQRERGVSWALDRDWGESPGAMALLGEFIGRWAGPQEIVFGPGNQVLRVVEDARPRGLSAIEIRQQVMMRCDHPQLLREGTAGLMVRHGSSEDLAWLLEAHGAMCREDLGFDQVGRNIEGYRRHFGDLLRRGLSFIGERDGRRVFKAEAPVVSDHAWLFEGVFTIPEERGRGVAASAMAQLAQQAAGRGLISCLYVHRRNSRALRLYGRLGYREVAPWITAMVSRDAPTPNGPLLW